MPTPEPLLDLLAHRTNHSTLYWLARVEALIRSCERDPTEAEREQLVRQGFSPDHKMGPSPDTWIARLLTEVEALHPTSPHDGNMWSALVAGTILVTWSLRLTRVKAMDEARPLGDRMPAYEAYLAYLHGLILGIVDERDDAVTFPHITKRLNPFSPDASSGSFR